jgi:histidyl-tRNA synthetase
VRLYYLASIFRYERPQAGRYREHHQYGYEAIGDGDPTLDAEVIDMAWRFFELLGLRNLSLQLNSIGCPQCRPQYLVALKAHYTHHANDLCPDCKTRLKKNPLRLLDCKQPQCQQVADSTPKSTKYLCPECDDHFTRLKKYLGLLGLPFAVNHRLVRGLDYYTRTVFEIRPEERGGQKTLGGGGRYDGLIEELGGKPTPAIGFAAGVERIILNLNKQDVSIPPLPRPQVFIAHIGDPAKDEALKLTSLLRQAGIAVITAVAGKSLKAQLRQANALSIPQALIIGEEEVRSGTVVLRDMITSQQSTVPTSELPQQLR